MREIECGNVILQMEIPTDQKALNVKVLEIEAGPIIAKCTCQNLEKRRGRIETINPETNIQVGILFQISSKLS